MNGGNEPIRTIEGAAAFVRVISCLIPITLLTQKVSHNTKPMAATAKLTFYLTSGFAIGWKADFAVRVSLAFSKGPRSAARVWINLVGATFTECCPEVLLGSNIVIFDFRENQVSEWTGRLGVTTH